MPKLKCQLPDDLETALAQATGTIDRIVTTALKRAVQVPISNTSQTNYLLNSSFTIVER